jgi:hypothetical protein
MPSRVEDFTLDGAPVQYEVALCGAKCARFLLYLQRGGKLRMTAHGSSAVIVAASVQRCDKFDTSCSVSSLATPAFALFSFVLCGF